MNQFNIYLTEQARSVNGAGRTMPPHGIGAIIQETIRERDRGNEPVCFMLSQAPLIIF